MIIILRNADRHPGTRMHTLLRECIHTDAGAHAHRRSYADTDVRPDTLRLARTHAPGYYCMQEWNMYLCYVKKA